MALGGHRAGAVTAESAQSHAVRNGLICAFVVAACVWAAYPVAEMGFIDDWSYAKMAQVFAQTGHIVYNGGTAPMLGWQGMWGALFIKLFGFSFTVMRLSMLPIAIAAIFLFHAILVRFGVNPRNAVLGTLTLGLSPLFLPLAASYMTDVPGLFVILLCLYLCQRAVAANSSNATIAWLCLAAATNVVGGTVRQIAWLGALVMVPSAGWLLRKRRGVLLTSSLLWTISAAGVFVCMRWFAKQPYHQPESMYKVSAFSHTTLARQLYVELMSAALCLLLLVYPILVAWLPKIRLLNRAALLRIALIILVFSFFEWTTRLPWLPNVIQEELAARRTDLYTLTPPPLFLPGWCQKLISLLVIAAVWVLMIDMRGRLGPPQATNKTDPDPSWENILWLLGPFILCYCALIAHQLAIFDRYLLPMMAAAILCLLKLHQKRIAETLPTISIAILAVFALSAICGTHDWFAWSRARLTAIDEIRASGVPRTEIQGGFEYDGWTQTEDGGHINDPRLKVPAGAYQPEMHPQAVPDECRFDFAPYTPAIHPKYTIVFPKKWCLAPSGFPPVNYRTWLTPYHGTIYIQTIPEQSN
jgi:hypothetical protein